MALFNVGWWNQLAHAIFGVQGDDPLPELSHQLQAVADLSALRPEWHYPAGSIPFRTEATTQPAVAANFSQVLLWVPPDTGILVVVEEIQHRSGLDQHLAVGAVNAMTGGFGLRVTPRDTRLLVPAATAVGGLSGRAIEVSAGFAVHARTDTVPIMGTPTPLRTQRVRSYEFVGNWNRLQNLWQVVGPSGFVGLETDAINTAITHAVFIGYVLQLHKGKRA